MDLLGGFAHGFAVLLSPLVLAACAVGLMTGVVTGFLPGISPVGGLALQVGLLAPLVVSFGDQSPVVIMVACAYGTLYGRALAAINQNACDARDAGPYPRSERRFLIAALLAGIAVAAAAGLLVAAARTALMVSFGPIELSALVAFVLLSGAAFGRGSAASALAMVILGLLLRTVGTDIETGIPRLTFGMPALADGIALLSVALGLFVIANVIDDLVRAKSPRERSADPADYPARGFWQSAILAVLAGFLPTNGATVATTVEARRSQPRADLFDPASQSSVAGILRAAMMSDIRLSVSLIPLLLLLAPIDAMTVLLRNTVNVQAILTNTASDLTPIVWLVCATLIVAHVVPLIVLARLATTRWRPISIDIRIVAPLLLAACCLVSWQVFDSALSAIGLMLVFGLIGYGMIRCGFDRSLMFFAFALGTTFEENIRRSLLITRGDPTATFERPIAAAFLMAGVLIFIVVRARRHRSRQGAYP
jgi:putative tricarboxylic transport membrane protein